MCALQAETGEMPLWIHRTQLMANCWINFKGRDESQPTHRVFLDACWERKALKSSSRWVVEDKAEQMKVQGILILSSCVAARKTRLDAAESLCGHGAAEHKA